jgi:DNA helicase HerA-like ATPase
MQVAERSDTGTGIKAILGLTEEMRIGTTSSDPYLGSPTFDEVPFHVHVGCRPALGTYIIIVGDADEFVHYGRIISGTEDNPRANPSALQQNQAYQVGNRDPRPTDKAPHVTRVMAAEVLGEIYLDDNSNITIKEPNQLAQTGKGVYELPADRIPQLLNIPDSSENGFHIGRVESGNSSVDFILPMEAIARHLAVVGKTGVGKSYFVGVLVEELVRHGIPVIAFDVLGDMLKATEDLGGCNFKAGENFRVPYSVIGVKEFLGFVPNLTPDQLEIVSFAYDALFNKAFKTLDETAAVNIPIKNLLDEIQNLAEEFGQTSVGGRAAKKVQTAFNRNSLLTAKTEEWLSEFVEKPITNIFVGHLSQQQRNLIVGATARMLQALRKREQVPPFVFVLDEAHFFLPSGGETTPSTLVIREMIRTARHDGIGIALITQSPASMDKQVILTCNTRVVFALDPDDLRLVSGTMGDVSEEMKARIPKLAKGTAIISSATDIMRHPALIKIRQRQTRHGAPTPNLAEDVKEWRKMQEF